MYYRRKAVAFENGCSRFFYELIFPDLQRFHSHAADGSGTLRLGIIENDSSRWLDEKQTQLHIDCHPLSDTKGFILEIENKREDITLGWAFGGCDATTPETDIEPQYCKDNVFNVEGTQVTVYHGKVMQLKVTNLIVPPLLADCIQKLLVFFIKQIFSGKKLVRYRLFLY